MDQKNRQPSVKFLKICKLLSVAVLVGGIITSSCLYAQRDDSQNNGALVVELINRVGAIEAENRELRGHLEESLHEIAQLKQRMETLSADVDYRLNNSESGSAVHPRASPSFEKESHRADSKASSSSAKDEYEKACALLEQGDYSAAEHAFSAFVASHPKDEFAGAAQYWLGVTFFVRGEYEKAAATFAKGYKYYPKSPKASDNLLKLAKSLAASDRKADACTALEQLATEHPKAHVKEVASERRKLGCK